MPMQKVKYTGETIVNAADGVSYAVIDISSLDFESTEAKWGKKTKPTEVRSANQGEEIITIISGVEESRYVCNGDEVIFINRLPDGTIDAFVPRDENNVPNGYQILCEKYELVGGKLEEGAFYRPIAAPSKLLHEIILLPSVLKNAWGEGNHAFLDKGATLKLDSGRVTGIAKAAFDETWSLTDVSGRVLNERNSKKHCK